ncbi:hypothetical protein [Streptomyces sp. NPDC059176]|uniref:hypothetical protein n=1 Tax=Streptomyces sp. NPDC059176 TaxID=3346758 RepID=UPI00368ABE72
MVEGTLLDRVRLGARETPDDWLWPWLDRDGCPELAPGETLLFRFNSPWVEESQQPRGVRDAPEQLMWREKQCVVHVTSQRMIWVDDRPLRQLLRGTRDYRTAGQLRYEWLFCLICRRDADNRAENTFLQASAFSGEFSHDVTFAADPAWVAEVTQQVLTAARAHGAAVARDTLPPEHPRVSETAVDGALEWSGNVVASAGLPVLALVGTHLAAPEPGDPCALDEIYHPEGPPLGYRVQELAASRADRSYARLFHLLASPEPADAKTLGRARDSLQYAISLIPDRNPSHLNLLGLAARNMFDLTDDVAELAASIDLLRQATQMFDSQDPDFPGALSNLGVSLQTLGNRSDDVATLYEAVETHEHACETVRANGGDLHEHLMSLAQARLMLFDRTDDIEILRQAVRDARRAAAEPGLAPAEQAEAAALAARALHTLRNEGEGGDEIFEGMISEARRACDLLPKGHPSLPDHLSGLGIVLASAFDVLGDVRLLTEAVSVTELALDTEPPQSPGRPTLLLNLGSFRLDFGRANTSKEQVAAAVDAHEQACKLLPADHPDRPVVLSALGQSLLGLFEMTGERRHLEAAKRASLAAVDAIPEDHPKRPAILTNHAAVRTAFEDA